MMLFFKSLMIGFIIAAPVGPIGLLCINRSLKYGTKVGLVSGLGAAFADAFYGAIGAFGLIGVMQFFSSHSQFLTVFGVAFLAVLGGKLIREARRENTYQATVETFTASSAVSQYLKAFLSTFVLTIANPITIFTFLAIFAGLSGSQDLAIKSAVMMVLGIFLGSALWWWLLSVLVALMRHKITPKVQQIISQCAGVLLVVFALWQLAQILAH